MPRIYLFLSLILLVATLGCKTTSPSGNVAARTGEEIVIAGNLFNTGTPVVLWTDPGGYNAYQSESRVSPAEATDSEISSDEARRSRPTRRYSQRRGGDLTPKEIERVRRDGWDLPTLQKVVDQFVIHYDVAGTSRQCFNVLQRRGISVHFLLDLDGTIYQTLDLQEAAWHATIANNRSVGIEIANMGAYGKFEKSPLPAWYKKDDEGMRIVLPQRWGDGGIRTSNFVGRPARPEPVTGRVQGGQLTQYDFTPEQYKALSHLVAALSTALPKIKCDYPRDGEGKLIARKLPDDELATYGGVVGHFHVQSNKVDPGPAFQWDLVIDEARKLMEQRKVNVRPKILHSPRQS